MKFTEIFRLKKMLEEANIPFQFSENFNGGFHIVYSFEGKVVCSVIEHEFSYGGEIPNRELAEKLQKYSSDFGDLREEPSWVSEIKIRYNL